MIQITDAQVISMAWTDALSTFVKNTRGELLLMSPWITTAAASLISHSLAEVGPVKLQILARLDEADFMSGASHIAAFKPATYPASTHIEIRALPMLHGKMLIADRQRVIIGSANMTEGGLHRNHEVCLLLDSLQIGQECAEVFFRFWAMASPLPDDYLSRLEETIEETLPKSDDEHDLGSERSSPPPRRRRRLTATFKYVRPTGATSARRQLAQLLQVTPLGNMAPENTQEALAWLTRTLRFLPDNERRSDAIVRRIERLMYHPDIGVRATAIDRAGRSGNRVFLARLQALVTNPTEDKQVRSAAAFSLGLLGSPEVFPVLGSLASDKGDVGRWARRGCFLLLNVVDYENVSWLLSELHVEEPATIRQLVNRCSIGSGTVAERLTKALVVEKLATKEWTESDIKALVYIMKLTAEAVVAVKRFSRLGAVIRCSADALRIAPGDLRHGPLSPALLRLLSESGFSDQGLSVLLGAIWSDIQRNDSSISAVLHANPRFEPALRVIEQDKR
jgi:PLD-like domain/HEAT repeats